LPVSKTDANAGTIRGRYKALRRAWREKRAAKAEAKYLEGAEKRERIREFINRTGTRKGTTIHTNNNRDRMTGDLLDDVSAISLADPIEAARKASRCQHARSVNLADWIADGNGVAEWCDHNGVARPLKFDKRLPITMA
jgi:hypothetical protein